MKSENTGIRVEAVKKINDRGEKGYQITRIVALTNNDLPELYMDNGIVAILGTGWSNPDNRLYLKNDGKACCFNGYDYIWPRFYASKIMEEINAHIAAAGQHLADVNRELAKNRKAWQGKVVFVDGIAESAEPLKPSKTSAKIGESVLDRISRLWAEGKLYYRNAKGHIKPLKPAETTLSEKPEPEQLYKITDGSWNLCSATTGMKHFATLARTNNKYRIINQGCDLPARQGLTPKRNDAIVQNVDTGQIVFTCAQFLRRT